ncbi:DUF4139 domain-containing protein [Marinicella sp. S1101]|uniref:DUF4139 domain-containing protein n=2 Tax=Marinicella marina TaxID=2996016 RepID=UPI0024BBF91E|nr:DUF4139 domain-containing protein [Marinicella marina]MCX7553615.1 DUF4139 domain-containing protein [Marinicella marina]MDJ1140239.1 DUF4139 domain-containing protein [Marinicella marina]
MKFFLKLTAIFLMINMSQADNSITIYSGNHQGHLNPNQLQNVANIPGYAMVKQSKNAAFKKGMFTLAFDDVAEHIDPTTVSFSTPDNPDAAQVLEQNFQFDLVGTEKLLQKYLDQVISVNHDQGSDSIDSEGKLLSTQGGITLQQQSGNIITIKAWNHISFPDLPGGLLTKPTLVWLLNSNSNKEELIVLTYQTQGMTWWADYNITLSGDTAACELDISSWVSLVNKSGASFNQTQLKLVAGDVNRTENNQSPRMMMRDTMVKASSNEFTEESLFEYHLYKLPRKVDLPNNSTKQIQLLNQTNGIKCNRNLNFNATGQHRINYRRPITDANYFAVTEAKVEATLSFENSLANQLGLPLPAGRVRVNMADLSDGSLEFIGEDSIEHTPKNDTIKLKLGNAFDVKAKRTQKDYELFKNSATEQIEISISNQKDSAATITVTETLHRWSNWQITQHDEEYKKLNASTIQFEVKVPAETTQTINYTVLYQWPE